MSKKNLSLLMDGFMGEANQAELAKEQPKEKAVEQVAEQAEQPAAQDDKQEIPKAAPAKASSKQETTETAAPEQLKSKLCQTQGECGSPQERRNSQKCQEAPGNPRHLHRGSGFGSQSEVHFPRGRHPLEGCYLRSAEQLCGCLGGEEQENPVAEGEVITCKNGANCYSLLRFVCSLSWFSNLLNTDYHILLAIK